MEGDRYIVSFSGSFNDFQIYPGDFAVELKDDNLYIKKHIQPRCPDCGSYEVAGERPLWKEREHERVIISFYCGGCVKWFDMEGSVIITNQV